MKLAIVTVQIVLMSFASTGCAKLNRVTTMPVKLRAQFENQIIEDGDEREEHLIAIAIPDNCRFFLGRKEVNSREELRALLLQRLDQDTTGQKAVYIKAAKL